MSECTSLVKGYMSMDGRQLLKRLDKAWVALKVSCTGLSDSQLTDRRHG
jgi:hypothetical protein